MPELLKNVYSKHFFNVFSKQLKLEISSFNEDQFSNEIFCNDWDSFELKQRITHIAKVLKNHLNQNYVVALNQICSIIDRNQRNHSNGFNFEFLFFPEFIQLYGLNDYQNSITAIEKITQYTSCEFVVRHFLQKYPDKMIRQMQNWAHHPHHYVRRLSSEGMRTRLPWAISVKILKENPKHILPILEKLITDESDWVRKSVSNSLNDLSKDYPEMTIQFTKKWINHSDKVNRALKHGNRTLLKNGHLEILPFFGINSSAKVNLSELKLNKSQIKIGDSLNFQFELENNENSDAFIRLEYRIYFLRSNGTYYGKTFKIFEKFLKAKEKIKISKNHSFKPITTRKYYDGVQKISVIVNGIEKRPIHFELKK